MLSSSIHTVMKGRSSFFLSAVQYSIGNVPQCFDPLIFIDGHLGCFQHLAIVSNVAMNIGVHRFFWIADSGFLVDSPSSGIAR